MGLIALALSTGFAWADPCEEIDFADIAAVVPPAIVVLGERRATSPDTWRARRVVSHLRGIAPVTLALDVVPEDRQAVLDRYADGEIEGAALPGALAWSDLGWPWRPYEPLVTGALHGVDVIAAGPTEAAPPPWKSFPVPQGYAAVWGDAVVGPPVPKSWEQHVSRAAAWQDYQIALLATRVWSGQGYLVIVADRARVEGSHGLVWQLEQLQKGPVKPFVLAWGVSPACYPGDRVWKRGIYDHLYARLEAEPASP